MGRYSTDIPSVPQQPVQPPIQQTPYGSQQPSYGAQPQPGGPWPTSFPKQIVSLDLNGTIIEDRIITSPSNIIVIPKALEAIRNLRLKGHKVFIISDQPDIGRGLLTVEQVENSFRHLMQVFGQAGIMSIDGMLHNASDMKEDEFAKPNTGMFARAERERMVQGRFKDGWHVGDSILDLKMAQKAGATPVLVLTGKGKETLEQLNTFSNKQLKKKTLVFNDLLEFEQSI